MPATPQAPPHRAPVVVPNPMTVPRHGMCRHGNDRDTGVPVGLTLPNRCGGLIAVHCRHLAVHGDAVIGMTRRGVDGFAPIHSHIHAAAELFQHTCGHLLIHRIILSYEHVGLQERLGFCQALGRT
jgi:hypothetical protein